MGDLKCNRIRGLVTITSDKLICFYCIIENKPNTLFVHNFYQIPGIWNERNR